MRNLFALFTAAFSMFCFSANAQFEGKIEFTKTIGPVTADYTYYVKDHLVRVEELGENGEIQGIMIVDSKANTVTALSPERKMFIEVPNDRRPKEVDVNVEKTANKKTINGVECTEWVVSCVADGREAAYWVADGDYTFFVPMLNTLNRKDKLAVYFNLIPDGNGFFPLEGVERKLNGTDISKLQVNNISRTAQEQHLFQIPAGYTKFERE